MDKGSLCKSCKHGATLMSAQPCSMCWNPAGDMFEPKEEARKKDTLASDEVIRGLVEALEEARVSLGEKYGFDKAPVKVQIQFRNIGKALAQARKHLQSEK